MKVKKIIIVGKAASGKDYLKKSLADKGFSIEVSNTTRPMRVGEIQGVDYNFMDDKKFNRFKYFERVVFNGWQYGTTMKNWKKNSVFIFTPSAIAKMKPKDREKCIVVFLDVHKNVRRERMRKRKGADNIERRLAADEKDFNGFSDYDLRITDPRFTVDTVLNLAIYINLDTY